MRLSFILTLLLMTTLSVLAQIPEKMSYQAVVRASDNSLVSNSNVNLRVIVRQGSENGTNTYEETHSAITNANGLVSLQIGNGNVVFGDFSQIPWYNGPFFIETQVDPTGGSNYSIIGISQLLSVPYALTAKYAENIIGIDENNTNRAAIISLTSSRNVNSLDINNTIECTSSATLTISSDFNSMEVGDTINLEAHNGALLTIVGAPGVELNYTAAGAATFESSTGNVRFGLLRKKSANSYIISGQ